jgi:hypothetical protein
MGSIDAPVAPWLNLTLGRSAFVTPGPDEVWPACFPDINGQVFLRGHINLSPVPAWGGGVLALFPQDKNGVCACTPKPDAGLQDNTIIATTTALAYPRDISVVDSADVCIVRLLISEFVRPDVNQDRVVDSLDLDLIYGSEFFNIDPSAASLCPKVGVRRMCGAVDVNQDGRVNVLDATSVTQSVWLGTNTTCGGVYATAFSCGSSRRAPLTPALDISLDSIVWFRDDGLLGDTNRLSNGQFKRVRAESAKKDSEMLSSIMDELERMDQDNKRIEQENKRIEQENKELKKKLQATDAKTAKLEAATADLKSTTADLKSTTADLKSTTADLKSTTADLQSKSAMHDKAISRFSKSPELLSEVALSVCVMLAASLSLFAWKRWRTKIETA